MNESDGARRMRFLERWFRRGKWERELGDELRFHVEQQTAANVGAGMPREGGETAGDAAIRRSRICEGRLPRATQRILARDVVERHALRSAHDGALARI